MSLRRRRSARLKKLVTSKVSLRVEASSPIQDQRLAQACTRPCGTYSPAKFQRRTGCSGFECRRGDGSAFEMGSGLEADQVQKRLSVEKPHLLILSPMCLVFTQLQALNAKPERVVELLEQGRQHLEFACSLAQPQVERGGRVLFEHPNEPYLKELSAIDGMRTVRCDLCEFGLTSVDGAGNVALSRKATGFMTSDRGGHRLANSTPHDWWR